MDMEDQSHSNGYIDGSKLPKIRVVVRKRPQSQKELNKNDQDVVDIVDAQTVVVKELKEKVDLTKYIEEHHFVFDQVFEEDVSNQDFYMQTVQPLVSALFLGSKVTCFAYGQTGSGKTHTMMGPTTDTGHKVPGMYLLAANDIFTLMEDDSMNGFSVYISFYEIYCGKLYDLLNSRTLVHAREDAKQQVKIMGLTEAQITSVEETMEVIDFGLKSRMTGSTAANDESSRSHAVMQVSIKQENGKLFGKMSFIDLAGSERGADAFDSKKETRMDGAEINKSLLALKECIRALDQSKKHKPFRGSKLTMVLKDSFQGNKCKTVMVANIAPTISCCEHTLNTLRYADRVKELKKEDRDTSNTLMLPRQATNSTRYELKRKNSSELKPKLTGMAAIQSNMGLKPDRPQTGAYTKGSKLKRPEMKKAKSNNDPVMPRGVDQNKIKSMLQRNPMGAAAMNRQQEHPPAGQGTSNYAQHWPPGVGSDDAAKRLNEAIQNAHKLSLENRENNEFAAAKQKFAQKQFNSYKEPKPQQMAPTYSNTDPDNIQMESEDLNLDDLKNQHEKLVDVILNEEDQLISAHHQLIESTINSIKEQERMRHEVNLPGSDVEDYIVNLSSLLSQQQDEIGRLQDMISTFHQHIKQEQSLSQRFYSMQEEQAEFEPEWDDYENLLSD